MRLHPFAASCACLLTLAGCGGSSGGSAGQTTVGSAAVASYQDLTTRVESAAIAYGQTMSAPGMTVDGCTAAHDAYDAQVRPLVSQMVATSGAMDGFMDAHGGAAAADMGCMATAMMSELDAHRTAACHQATLGEDQAEAARHVGVMTTDAAHVSARCGTMMGGMGGGGYAWGPAAPGCGTTPPGGTPSDPVALGQRIFDWGIGADGQPIARTGGTMMSGGGCASCHGSDGHGRQTMMFTTPNITYANLTDPAGMLDPDGSRGPTYTDALIQRAVVQGIGADGQPLDPRMPQWQMGDPDFAALLAYLKTLR